MRRTEAETEARRLNAEHSERERYRWLASEGDEGWRVVRIPVPPGSRVNPLKVTTEARPKPPDPEDPRSPFERNVGGPWGPG